MTLITLKPFFQSNASTLNDPNSDLDPDLNNQSYASLASYCNYKTAEDLNGVIVGNKLISFSLFHLNARSLVKNQDALACPLLTY